MSEPVISLRRPLAWAILHAGKRIINVAEPIDYRGYVLIHTHTDDATETDAAEVFFRSGLMPGPISPGGIVGRTHVIGCVSESANRWFTGPHGIVLGTVEELLFVGCGYPPGFTMGGTEMAA